MTLVDDRTVKRGSSIKGTGCENFTRELAVISRTTDEIDGERWFLIRIHLQFDRNGVPEGARKDVNLRFFVPVNGITRACCSTDHRNTNDD